MARSDEAIAAEELDAILEEALDDFEDKELGKLSQQTATMLGSPSKDGGDGRADQRLEDEGAAKATAALEDLADNLKNPEYGDVLQKTLKELSSNAEGNDVLKNFLSGLDNNATEAGVQPDMGAAGVEGTGPNTYDRAVVETLHQMTDAAQGMEGMEAAQVEQYGENMMNNMIAEFERLGEKEDFQVAIDGMMRQLLSKDLMYEPMKQVCDKYPEWLADKREQLTEEEYLRYGHQYQYFQRIVAVYQTEPDNFPRLMELMQDVQQYGQPPAEIIKELAPGLEFNDEGLPVMPNMAGNTMPSTEPGMPGIPMPDPSSGQCAVS